MSYLDKTGLSHLITKLKSLFLKSDTTVSGVSAVTSDSKTNFPVTLSDVSSGLSETSDSVEVDASKTFRVMGNASIANGTANLQTLTIQNKNVTRGTAPSAYSDKAINITDSKGAWLVTLESRTNTDNFQEAGIRTWNNSGICTRLSVVADPDQTVSHYVSVPNANGTLMLTGLAPGTYELSDFAANGVQRGSNVVHFWLCIPLAGRSIKISLSSLWCINSDGTTIKPVASENNAGISSSALSKCTYAFSRQSVLGTWLSITAPSHWYEGNSTTVCEKYKHVSCVMTGTLTVT